MLQESQVPYGYMMTNEQLWLAFVDLQAGCMYLSDAISMRFQAGRPTVPTALLWLASQHTAKPQQLPKPEAFGAFYPIQTSLRSFFGQSSPPKQPVWRHVAQPDDAKPGMTYAKPEETADVHPLIGFDPHSRPHGRGASGRAWSAAKVPLSKSAILTPLIQSQSCILKHNSVLSTHSCKAVVFRACWGRAGSSLRMKRRLPTGWLHPWKALPSPAFTL